MKNKYKYLLIFLIFTIITFLYSFYIFHLNNDEMWNYGFAHNIYQGLIPYKDFNMIIPPLFAFCVQPFFLILGDSLFTFHLFTSIVVGLTILFLYSKSGKNAFLTYPFIIIGYLPSYNLFCIFLFSILILIDKSKLKQKDILLGVIASLMFLTKQTIGAAIFLPCLFYSKNKIKTIISFTIPIFIFLIYLTFNNALYQFIDYCFLGMFSFVKDNKEPTYNLIITGILSIILIYKLIKSKFKLSSCFYALMFQVMILPMGDNYHFYTATSVLIYALFENLKLPIFKYLYLFILFYMTTILINVVTAINRDFTFNLYKEDCLFKGRNAGAAVNNYVAHYQDAVKKADTDGYDHLFLFSKSAYFLKLSQNYTLNKYDLINNGNMGYKGAKGYIEDIESMCKDKACVFIVEIYTDEKIGQTSEELLKYPQDNARLIHTIGLFNVYTTKKIT